MATRRLSLDIIPWWVDRFRKFLKIGIVGQLQPNCFGSRVGVAKCLGTGSFLRRPRATAALGRILPESQMLIAR
jgi:hypothetical protein